MKQSQKAGIVGGLMAKQRRNEPTMTKLTKKPLALHQRQHP